VENLEAPVLRGEIIGPRQGDGKQQQAYEAGGASPSADECGNRLST